MPAFPTEHQAQPPTIALPANAMSSTTQPGKTPWTFGLLCTLLLLCWLYMAQYAIRNFGVANGSAPHAYITLDWLINYGGGFVRRGLSGELIHLLQSLTGWRSTSLAIAIPLAAYACFCISLLRLTGRKIDLAVWALLLSPLALGFPIADPSAMLRKEFLHFALLAWLACRFSQGKPLGLGSLLVIAIGLPLLALMHELVYPVLPFYGLLVWASWRDGLISHRGFRLTTAWLAFSLLGIALAIVRTSGGVDIPTMCASLQFPAEITTTCQQDSAIAWLGQSSQAGLQAVAGNIRHRHYLEIYGYALVAALLTLSLCEREMPLATRSPSLRTVHLAGLASLVLFIPFFAVALDWGRWLSILFVSLTISLLAFRAPNQSSTSPLPLPLQLLILGQLMWGVPHAAGQDRWSFGVLGIVLGKLGL